MKTTYICTSYILKFNEIANHLKQYCPDCRHILKTGEVSMLLQNQCIILEKSVLIDFTTSKMVQPNLSRPLQNVIHVSTVTLITAEKRTTWTAEVSGTIDFSRRTTETLGDQERFDWDDIFVVDKLGKTILEVRKITGSKVSARDLALAQCVEQYFKYSQRRDLFHRPLRLSHSLTFDYATITRTIMKPFQYNRAFCKFGLSVLNSGVFLRSAKDRREALYWCPGLNAGIPLVSKKHDPAHENTFAVHDVIHFLLPDLVPDGNTSKLAQLTYVSYRLCSEIIALIMADMIYVSGLKEYPTSSERKIYPVFQQFGQNQKELSKILDGGFYYMFYNDLTIWRQLSQGQDADSVLDDFRQKYDNFVALDLWWTLQNWQQLAAKSQVLRSWWNDIKLVTENISGVTDFIKTHSLDNEKSVHGVIQKIFEVMKNKIMTIWKDDSLITLDKSRGLTNAFKNYMAGQLLVFYEKKIHETADYRKTLIKSLSLLDKVTNENINDFRCYYNKYLLLLVEKRMISPDDQVLFSNFYPIFEAFSVNYNKKLHLGGGGGVESVINVLIANFE